MKLSDIMVTEAIVPELAARDKQQAVQELVESLAEAGAITRKNVATVTQAVLDREEQATTGIGKGIALPHAKLSGIKKPIGTIGRSSEGLDFNALDAKPVFSVILLLSSPDNPDEHLQAMETIFKHVQRDIFRKFLRQSQTQQAIIELIQEADELG
jgi:mannitol/fructose-specific phosphotransferase system IIA component (Ntr-type)